MKRIFITGASAVINAENPDYSAYIPPMVIRRMSPIMKRAVYTAKKALAETEIKIPQAIITGTGSGCVKDTELFLSQMIESGGVCMQPTHFIQSTHNTMASQIALLLKAHGYNNTFSHLDLSFDSALWDAVLQLRFTDTRNALVGGYDEITATYAEILKKTGFYADFSIGEGGVSFILETEPKKEAYAEIVEIKMNRASVIENEKHKILHQFSEEGKEIRLWTVEQTKAQIGHYHTVSAYALFCAANYVKKSKISVLLFNESKTGNHTLIQLQACGN